MCPVGPGAIFALYPDDEGSGETVGTGYDMEEGLYGTGLGIFCDGLRVFVCVCPTGLFCVGLVVLWYGLFVCINTNKWDGKR